MPVNKVIFFQKNHVNFNNLKVVRTIAEKLNKKLVLLLIDVPDDEKSEVSRFLSDSNIEFELKNQLEFDEAKEHIKQEKPDLLVVTQEKVSPLEHIFRITSSEKLVKSFENIDILMLLEDADSINKVLINVDKETSTPFYIKSAHLFVKKLGVEFDFITSFYESFYEYRLRKTHPDEEAKQLVLDLFKEHVEIVKRKIAEGLEGEKVELVVIKGDPKKEIPYYARRRGYDLLIINEDIDDKESYIENSETSVGIFKDEKGE
ncbi:hypothetical protein [Persephonella sp.]|nr:universal stress protein [Aquificota bacterium]